MLMMLGTVVQGSIGFGQAVISAPLLLLVNPEYVPGPIIFPIILLTFLMAVRDRDAIQRSVIPMATVGRIVGTIPAAYALVVMSQTTFDIFFGFTVLGAVVMSIANWHIPPTTRNVAVATAVSGFTGTISSIGGPPLALVYQREEGPAIRGTLSAIFFIGATLSLLCLWWVGLYGWSEFLLSLVLMPGMIIGFVVTRWTKSLVDGRLMRPAVLVLSSASAVAVLGRAIWL